MATAPASPRIRAASARALLAVLGCLVLASCAGSGGAGGRRWPRAGTGPARTIGPAPAVSFAPLPVGRGGVGFPTEILEPLVDGEDAVFARVGDVEIRKSDAFDRLLEIEGVRVQAFCERLVQDAMVAAFARRYEIVVDEAEIAAMLQAHEDEMRASLERVGDPVDDETFRAFVESQFGMTLEAYRRRFSVDLARQRYRGYVVRYLRLLEEQVVLRGLWNRDRELVDRLALEVREGADFAKLARRHSDHQTARDGGLLPPLTRSFESPITEPAFELAPGEVSDVLTIESETGVQFAIFYCLERRPPRDADFAEVRDELRADLERRPLEDVEYELLFQRWTRGFPELDRTPLEQGR
jgi:hypothetical protein